MDSWFLFVGIAFIIIGVFVIVQGAATLWSVYDLWGITTTDDLSKRLTAANYINLICGIITVITGVFMWIMGTVCAFFAVRKTTTSAATTTPRR